MGMDKSPREWSDDGPGSGSPLAVLTLLKNFRMMAFSFQIRRNNAQNSLKAWYLAGVVVKPEELVVVFERLCSWKISYPANVFVGISNQSPRYQNYNRHSPFTNNCQTYGAVQT